jgi:hypothetical protein
MMMGVRRRLFQCKQRLMLHMIIWLMTKRFILKQLELWWFQLGVMLELKLLL